MEYTVKEIADLLQVSKTTVQNTIKTNNIKYEYVKKNRQYYTREQAIHIIGLLRTDFDFSIFEKPKMKIENQTAKPPTKTENPPTKTANLQIETEKPTSDIDTMNRMLDMLQQEIEKKDITIKELQDKLEKAYIEIADLAKQAHYIAAADKTAKIIDKQQEDKVSKRIVTTAADIGNIEQGQPQKRKSIFERLFNR